MKNYFSLRMKLEDVIFDKDKELVILENIRRCRKIVGHQFKIIFWHNSLGEDIIKEFIHRNEKLLFEVTTKITKEHDYGWFVIDTNKEDKSRHRYTFYGDILSGIVQYLEIIKVMHKREKNEDSYNR